MIWLPGDANPEPRGRWTEVTESFSMSLQCDHFDPRLKFKKVDFFQSQKVSCRESEVEAKSEAAYQFCKRMVLKRYNELARAIEARRLMATPYPIEAPQATQPQAKANARAFEEHQEKIAAIRSAPSTLRPPSNDGTLPWEDKPVPTAHAPKATNGQDKILGENYTTASATIPTMIRGENIN